MPNEKAKKILPFLIGSTLTAIGWFSDIAGIPSAMENFKDFPDYIFYEFFSSEEEQCNHWVGNPDDIHLSEKASEIEDKKIDKAITACQKAITKRSGWQFYHQVARIHEKREDYKKAIDYYKIATENGYRPAQVRLGYILYFKNRMIDASAKLLKEPACSNDTLASLYLGMLLYERSKNKELNALGYYFIYISRKNGDEQASRAIEALAIPSATLDELNQGALDYKKLNETMGFYCNNQNLLY